MHLGDHSILNRQWNSKMIDKHKDRLKRIKPVLNSTFSPSSENSTFMNLSK